MCFFSSSSNQAHQHFSSPSVPRAGSAPKVDLVFVPSPFLASFSPGNAGGKESWLLSSPMTRMSLSRLCRAIAQAGRGPECRKGPARRTSPSRQSPGRLHQPCLSPVPWHLYEIKCAREERKAETKGRKTKRKQHTLKPPLPGAFCAALF